MLYVILGQAHRVIIATVRRTFWPNRNVTAWEFLLVEFMGHGSVSLQEVSFQKGAVHARELRHSRRMVARTPANLRCPASSLTRDRKSVGWGKGGSDRVDIG